jgi:hypothetical protein
MLAIPRVRNYTERTSTPVIYQCVSHKTLSSGFCSFCGKKVARATTRENFGGWGLLVVCAVVGMLVISSMPMLAIGEGVQDAVFTSRGPTLTALPITPKGWQINSTVLDTWDAGNGTFETIRVYVPLVHPEVKNYTVYYSVAPSQGILSAPSGNFSDWKWISSTFISLAGFQGRLPTYTTGNSTVLSYGGSRTMTFLHGYGFLRDYVSIGYVREFKNLNVSANTSQFLGDLQTVWVPILNNDSFNSGWTAFVRSMVSGASDLLPLLEIVASVSIIGWIAYRVTRMEKALDGFYSAAALAREKSWSILFELLKKPKRPRAGYELWEHCGHLPQDEVESALESLAREGLVRTELIRTGDDILLAWKANV